MSFDIIVIYPNDIKNLNPESEEFNLSITECTQIVTTNNESFNECIIEHLNMYNENGSDLVGDTEVCDETVERKIFQFCYIDPFDNDGMKPQLYNKLASNLLYSQKRVTGTVVLFGCQIIKNGTAKNISTNITDLKNILNRKFIHTGIYCHSSNKLLEFTFHNDMNIFNNHNQCESIRPRLPNIWELLKTGIYYEISIFKYNLVIVTPTNDYINEPSNKIISLLLNSMDARGSFIILHKITETEYYDITITELKKMVYLHKELINGTNIQESEPLTDLTDLTESVIEPVTNLLTEAEIESKIEAETNALAKQNNIEKIDGLVVIKNKYITLYNKYNKYKQLNSIINFDEFCNNEYTECPIIFNEFIKNNIPKNE